MTEKSRTALRAGVLFTLLIVALPSAGELAAGSMDVKWNEGAEDCSKTAQPPCRCIATTKSPSFCARIRARLTKRHSCTYW